MLLCVLFGEWRETIRLAGASERSKSPSLRRSHARSNILEDKFEHHPRGQIIVAVSAVMFSFRPSPLPPPSKIPPVLFLASALAVLLSALLYNGTEEEKGPTCPHFPSECFGDAQELMIFPDLPLRPLSPLPLSTLLCSICSRLLYKYPTNPALSLPSKPGLHSLLFQSK